MFQDRPCSTGFSAPVRMAPPVASAAPASADAGTAGEEEAVAPRGSGHDNVREYLQSREREREQRRAEQRQDFDAAEERQRRGSALARIDERLRTLRMQQTALALNTQERDRAAFDEQRLQRLRARVEAGYPGAVDEALAGTR